MIEVVLFEFDGVVADTRAARRSALLGALGEAGVLLTETEYVERCASFPLRDAIRTALALRHVRVDDTAIDLTTRGAEHRFRERLHQGITLADGARELVDHLQGRSRVGIVSRASREDIEFVLRLAGMESAFECIVADEDAFPSKPSPAPYLTALERLTRRHAVRSTAVVALEDGPAGIRSARGAGVRCAVVGAVPVHLAIDADALLPTLAGQTVTTLDRLVVHDGEFIQ
jgi:beta-phosphoglucomutase-like phosphatase (HAD superfamily)